MKAVVRDDCVVLELQRHELLVLANALNEARELIEDWEFPTRLGVTLAEAETLLSNLRHLLRTIPPSDG